jgi:hypothetical protein
MKKYIILIFVCILTFSCQDDRYSIMKTNSSFLNDKLGFQNLGEYYSVSDLRDKYDNLDFDEDNGIISIVLKNKNEISLKLSDYDSGQLISFSFSEYSKLDSTKFRVLASEIGLRKVSKGRYETIYGTNPVVSIFLSSHNLTDGWSYGIKYISH